MIAYILFNAELQIHNVHLNCFGTQCGRSHHPNLGSDALFAGPLVRVLTYA